MKNPSKPSWLFYALVVYVLMQFVWWEVLLARQSKQLAEERKKIIALNMADKTELERNLAEIDKKRSHQLIMHVGEGTVFLILLSLGILKIYNTRKRENELIRLQNNFLLSVTHELKSPLASIKLQLQTMQKHRLDAETQGRLVQKALSDNERLLRMIDNILLASKTGKEKGMLSKRQVNLSELLFKLVEQGFDESKGRIKLSSDGNHFIEGDEQILAIIFSNLIENALKYSPDSGHVEISVAQLGTKTIAEVRDNGPGIPHAEKEKVFEKFYRIGNEETRSAKGTGLGLYIAKDLCALHGIGIRLSDNKPKGSVLTLEI